MLLVSIVIFSGLNIALGAALVILAALALLHLLWGLRFSPEQESVAMRFFLFCTLFTGVNIGMSGILGTLANYAALETQVPVLAIIPLIAKVLAVIAWWSLIFWVVFGFYPKAQRRS